MDIQWVSMDLQIAPVHPEDKIPHCPSHANAMDIQWVSMDLQIDRDIIYPDGSHNPWIRSLSQSTRYPDYPGMHIQWTPMAVQLA